MFDVNITKHVDFKNYVAKNPSVDDRVFKNGNRLFFLEPMESSSNQAYIAWVRFVYLHIFHYKNSYLNDNIIEHIKQLQNIDPGGFQVQKQNIFSTAVKILNHSKS